MSKAEVWSCGGGTQSGAIATLIGMGKLPKPDICFMTDTGREKSSTWPFVDGFIRPQLAQVGAIVAAITRAAVADFSGFDVDFSHPNYHVGVNLLDSHGGVKIWPCLSFWLSLSSREFCPW